MGSYALLWLLFRAFWNVIMFAIAVLFLLAAKSLTDAYSDVLLVAAMYLGLSANFDSRPREKDGSVKETP